MKFIQLADLHLGKRVNGFSMIEDQRYILDQILHIIDEERPDAVLIAGDVYDKPLPPAEAVMLFDDLISNLSDIKTEVMVISGNHDSPERLSFGSRIMEKSSVHFAGIYDGTTHKVRMKDGFGHVNFYLLPFIKPSFVRAAFGSLEEASDVSSYTDALGFAIKKMDVNTDERNVLIAHQFVTGGERSESEEISIGGLDNVDSDVFACFDYTALGHLHRPQNIGGSCIRYSGSPLKYSFSEANHNKSVTIVELGNKGDEPHVETRDLKPLHDMKELKGSFSKLTDINYYEKANTDDYLRIILTDEEDIIGAVQSLRAIYPNMMRLDYDNKRTRSSMILPDKSENDMDSPLEIFESFYKAQNGSEMDEGRRHIVKELIEDIWSEDK